MLLHNGHRRPSQLAFTYTAGTRHATMTDKAVRYCFPGCYSRPNHAGLALAVGSFNRLCISQYADRFNHIPGRPSTWSFRTEGQHATHFPIHP